MGKPRFYGKTTACTSNRKWDKRYMEKVARQNREKPRISIWVAATSKEREDERHKMSAPAAVESEAEACPA